jgi:hypothetical protein
VRAFNIITKVSQNLGVRKRGESKFEDFYWDLFEKSDLSILQDLNQDFHINHVDMEEKFLFKFEHIPLTGGSNVNNTFKDNALGDILQIPGYEQVWANPRTARPFTPLVSKRVISAHYLHGTKIVCDLPIKSFSFMRDPRKFLISTLQIETQLSSNESLDETWKRMEKKLHNIHKNFKHANNQLYELATPNSKKKFPYVHRKPAPIINFENIRGCKPAELREKVEERLTKDLCFTGICENFSESLVILYEKLGINKIKLWTPGLYSYKKLTFEEAPEIVQELVLSLCQEEIEFYKKIKRDLAGLISESTNQKVISAYVLENKRPDLKFVQGVRERLDLASAVSNLDNSRVKKEISYLTGINQHIKKIIKDQTLLLK